MIHRIHSSMLLAAFALTVASCGGSDGPPTKLSEALLDAAQRQCQKSFDCKASYIASMHANQSFENYVGGATVDACFNSVKTLVLTFNGQDYFTKLDASVAAGRIKYNPNDYDTCLKAGEAESCDQLFKQNGAMGMPPAACDTASAGLVPTAGSCTLDEDCAGVNDSCDETQHTCG